MTHQERIYRVLNSSEFKEALKPVAKNYFNLKQELVFRNLLLEKLNEGFENEKKADTLKAIAEFRGKFGNNDKNKQIDLAIFEKDKDKKPYSVELKYRFSGDFSENVISKLIYEDYEERESDMFILVILDFDKEPQKNHDNSWGIEVGLSGYIPSPKKKWKDILNGVFEKWVKDGHHHYKIDHEIEIKTENHEIVYRYGIHLLSSQEIATYDK